MKPIFTNVPFNKLSDTICKLLILNGLEADKAAKVANTLANSTLDGINSHGVNRFPLFLEYIQKGHVSIDVEPEIVNTDNSFCQVDGKFGLGILNAHFCTNKAIEIASTSGIGLVSLKNTNHWHRAGSYGWEAANKGFILIAWTNTIPIVPPYGSKENLIGNNPVVIAIPRKNNEHVVLDMSISQYSYGAMAQHDRQKKELSEYGGYDASGKLTKNASEIINGGRHMPIGYWKGSALTIVLDFIAAILSGGKTTNDIAKNGDVDTGMSQIYLAIDPKKFGDEHFQQNLINDTLNNFKVHSDEYTIRYPGEGVYKRRKENLKNGIPIEKEIWEKILSFLEEK